MVCFSKRKQDKGLVNLHRDAQDLENLHFCVFLFLPKDLTASKTPLQLRGCSFCSLHGNCVLTLPAILHEPREKLTSLAGDSKAATVWGDANQTVSRM